MRLTPLIAVNDVQLSSTFYQQLLNCRSGHGGNEYEMLMQDDLLVLQLHKQDIHEHEGMYDPEVPKGNGMILWFQVNDFELAVERANKLDVEIVSGPMFNNNAAQHELWFRDPDGYLVVISGRIKQKQI